MKFIVRCATIILLLLSFGFTSCKQDITNNYLILFNDTIKNECGYKSLNGEVIIPPGKYSLCFTDTFRTFAIVAKSGSGFVAIDRKENILYEVFLFDNGPDYVSDGLFRIVENNKIGYADATTGKIVIKPQFDCAWPFENGWATVSTDCTTQTDGEYKTWKLNNNWHYIDKTGKRLTRKKQ